MRLTTLTAVVLAIPLIAVTAWALALGSTSPLPDAILPLSFFPFLALTAFLGLRAWRPHGAPALRFDDRLGQEPLADFVRVVIRMHAGLVTANLPGAVGPFTLTVIDRPVRKLIPPPKGARQLAVTCLHPLLPPGVMFLRAHGLPLRPAVCIVRSSWPPSVQRNPIPRSLERLMIEVLYHELLHLYGYGHGPVLNHLSERFARLVRDRLEGEARHDGPGEAGPSYAPAPPARKR